MIGCVGTQAPGDRAHGTGTRGTGGRARRGSWAVVAGCLVACLVACTTTARGSVAVGPPARAAGASAPDRGAPAAPVRVLQMNLCSSGIAACYTGRSTARAAAVIRAERPDLVTLNEVCEDDVSALERAMAEVAPGGRAVSAFQAARNGRTGEPYRCRNGRQYGIGLVSHWPTVPGSATDAGIYPAQDRDDPEERAWLCLDVAAPGSADGAVSFCTTHLAYTKREVTNAQCRYLLDTVIGAKRARDAAAPVVLGADLNLGSGDSPDLRACLPADSARVDDGGQQHIMGTPEFVVAGSTRIDLADTTDHPGLLATLAPRDGRRTP